MRGANSYKLRNLLFCKESTTSISAIYSVAIMFFLLIASKHSALAQIGIKGSPRSVTKRGIRDLGEIIDPSISLPVMLNSGRLCVSIQDAWQSYLKKSNSVTTNLSFSRNSLGYSGSFTCQVDTLGRVINLKKGHSNADLDLLCYNIISSALKDSMWKPACRKKDDKCRAILIDLAVYYYVKPRFILQVEIKEMSHLRRLHECK